MVSLDFVSTEKKAEEINPCTQVLLVLASVPEKMPASLCLSEAEKMRASRFVKKEVKQSYEYQHHLLRNLLSKWLHTPPEEINFSSNPFGKPTLQNAPFSFNFSRSGNQLAFYFGPTEGGIDIETIRPSASFNEIAKQHFHSNEQDFISTDQDFFTIWTRKEAVLKAMGTGLQSTINDIDTTENIIFKKGHPFEIASYQSDKKVVSFAMPHDDFQTPICLSL
jgi:4'-phosphopantetheinyl transferase